MADAAISPPAPRQHPIPSMRFSTAHYAPRDRLAAWRDIYGRTLLKLDIEPIETDDFHADVVMRKLPGLAIIVGERSATLYRRDRTDNDDLILSIGLAGAFEATQFGRTAVMQRGDAVIVTGAEKGYVRVPASGPSLSLCVPWRTVASSVPGFDAALCRRIPADSPALQLLTRYVGFLEESHAYTSPDLQRHAVTHIHDLLALAIGATREAAEVARGRGARAAWQRIIKQDIIDHLDQAALSAKEVAARHGVSPRYVRMLFESEGLSFTDYVLAQRLDRAYRMLRDPRRSSEKIATIAYDAGFGDLSYFNRAFRCRFGATPSDIRMGTQRLDA